MGRLPEAVKAESAVRDAFGDSRDGGRGLRDRPSDSGYDHDEQGQPLRHFSWVELRDGQLQEISHRWYAPDGALRYRQTLMRAPELQPC